MTLEWWLALCSFFVWSICLAWRAGYDKGHSDFIGMRGMEVHGKVIVPMEGATISRCKIVPSSIYEEVI